jgi:hypothetical protein
MRHVMFALTISCVDGETLYQLTTSNPRICRRFLEQHDHEGSSVSLFVTDSDNWTDDHSMNEDCYTTLDQWITALES